MLGLQPSGTASSGSVSIRCPAPSHEDKNPSCSVYLSKGGLVYLHCHSCGFRGDVFTLIAAANQLECRGSDFRQVVAIAEQLATETRCSTAPANLDVPANFDDVSSSVFEVLLELAPVRNQHDLCDYLGSRGLLELCLSDGWGGLPRSLQDQRRLLDHVVATLGRDAWRAAGLGEEDFDFPDHRILIPYRTPQGDVETLGRRSCEVAGRRYVLPRGRSPKWPFGIDVAVAAARLGTAIAFAEGAASTLAARHFCQAEQRPWVVIGVPSASSWHAEWAYLATGRSSILLLDADGAGKALAKRMTADLRTAGSTSVMTAAPPFGCKDWDELLVRRMR